MAYSDWKINIVQIITASLILLPLGDGRMYVLNLGVKGLTRPVEGLGAMFA